MSKSTLKFTFLALLAFLLAVSSVSRGQQLQQLRNLQRSQFEQPRTVNLSDINVAKPVPLPTTAPVLRINKAKAADDSTLVFWGDVIFRYYWNYIPKSDDFKFPYQMSSFSLTPGSRPVETMLNYMPGIQARGGGAIYNNRWHFVNYGATYSGTLSDVKYYEYSLDGWSLIKEIDLDNDPSFIASVTAYDPSTKRVYGQFYSKKYNSQGKYQTQLAYVDYENMTKTVIANTDSVYYAMACDANGQLYGIQKNGNLYRINKETGEETLVGATGKLPMYIQSAAFDYSTGKLYWAESDESSSGFYEVDTTTGQATQLASFGDMEEITCLYFPPKQDQQAPVAVTDLKADFPEGNLAGTISFTAPTMAIDSTNLEGSLRYAILSNDDTLKTGTTTPGNAVNAIVSTKEGMNKFVVIVSNDKGESKHKYLDKYVGYDYPVAVSGIKTNIDDNANTATVTWNKTSTQGNHAGYVDTANVTYNVIRKSATDSVTLATGLNDTMYVDRSLPKNVNLAQYSYYIVADNHGKLSSADNYANAIIGSGLVPPYYETFQDQDGFNTYTVVDGNNDGDGWYFDGSSVLAPKDYNGSDDWLITPPLHLTPDREYTFRLQVTPISQSGGGYAKTNDYSYGYNSPKDTISAAMGEGLDPSNFKEVIKPTALIAGYYGMNIKTYEEKVVVDKEGKYHFGIHLKADQFVNQVQVNSVMVLAEKPFESPDSVKNLTVTPAPKGELKATVSFDSPTKNVRGNDLSSLTKILIVNNNDTVDSIVNPVIGKHYDVTVNASISGTQYIQVIPINEAGEGITRKASTYVGFDKPKAPKNVKLIDSGDHLTLTWDAPDEKGINGGYVDVASLVYNVYSVKDGKAELYEDNVRGNSLDITTDMTGEQHFVYYQVTAKSDLITESTSTQSNGVLIGDAHTLPFIDHFPGGKPQYTTWWQPKSGGYEWEQRSGLSSDGDDGCIDWTPSYWSSNDSTVISTGKITLAGVDNPKLIFDYYLIEGSDYEIKVTASRPGKKDALVAIAKGADFKGNGFVTMPVSLNQFKSDRYIILNFIGKRAKSTGTIAFDNVRVENVLNYNLKAELTAPKKASIGETAPFSVKVTNIGERTAMGYTVELYVGDSLIGSQTGDDLAFMKDSTYSFYYAPAFDAPDSVKAYAKVVYDADLDQTDNTTYEESVAINKPVYKRVNDLTAAQEGESVNLAWTSPSKSTERVTDDFEAYSPFIISGIGGYSTVDGDSATTSSITTGGYWNQKTYKFNHSGKPYAWIVSNPTQLGVTEDGWSAHSGEQYLMSSGALPYGTKEGLSTSTTKDWLISPEFSGKAQTITFWTRHSAKNYYNNDQFNYRVLYSTTDKDTASFIPLDTLEAQLDWNEISVNVPEGTKYVAIENVFYCSDCFLMLDDFSYDASALKVDGYDIYRDGKKLAHVDGNVNKYTDTTVTDGKSHTYYVVVCYAAGESALSNPASITTITGINDLQSEGKKVAGYVTVSGLFTHEEPQHGVYIIKYADGSTRKVSR